MTCWTRGRRVWVQLVVWTLKGVVSVAVWTSRSPFVACFHTLLQERLLQLLSTRCLVDTPFILFDTMAGSLQQRLIKSSLRSTRNGTVWKPHSHPWCLILVSFSSHNSFAMSKCNTLVVQLLRASFMSSSDVLSRPRCFYLKPHQKQLSIDWRLFVPFGVSLVSTGLVSVSYLDESPRNVPLFCLNWPGQAFLVFYKNSGHFWYFEKISGIFGISSENGTIGNWLWFLPLNRGFQPQPEFVLLLLTPFPFHRVLCLWLSHG